MLISVFTPTHTTKFLADAYASLRDQTYRNWEWVLLPNGQATAEAIAAQLPADDRIRIVGNLGGCDAPGVGFLKRRACEESCGEILLELDHDDLLMPNALSAVVDAFTDPTIDFVYSNCAEVNLDWSSRRFNEAYGWIYRTQPAFGHQVDECRSPEPLPQNLSRIWFAPDHLRAWRTASYWLCGGHDDRLGVADDHDLICRTYLSGKLKHLDELLYIRRVTGENTWLARNAEIQEQQWRNYERYKERLATRWAEDRGLLSLDAEDLELIEDGSVGMIRAGNLASMKDPIAGMNQIHRVLAHGGFFFSATPSTDGRGAFQDPTHNSFWNQNSFQYYTKAPMRAYLPHVTGRFQEIRLRTIGDLPYVQADLIALKDGPRFHGLQEI
jgi:glycosyltransferase involved in cell wall biosynthesis